MTMTLTMRHCPDGVAPETRKLAFGTISIGRSTAADWVLPDPERVLSKRHCVVSFENAAWQVIDTSANGTFLNHAQDRLVNDEPRQLRNGDRLLLGSYEIEAVIEETATDARAMTQKPRASLLDERLIGDPFPPLETDLLDIALPPGEAPIDFGDAPVSDHVPAVAAEFRPPKPRFDLLPEDWDIDLPAPSAAAAPAPAPAPAAVVEPPAVRSLPPEPPAAPLFSPAPVPIPAEAVPSEQSAQAALAAFIAGAGLKQAVSADPLAVMQSLGAAFRAFVGGLRRVMTARAAIKGEFRIDQTMIQAVGNNPLKFSVDDADAMTALLGIGRRLDMTAERAVGEAMRDIRLHELAMTTAMQQAVRDLLAGLKPSRVAAKAPAGGLDFLPWRRAARRWDAFVAQHELTEQALADDFDTVFGKSFMRAYERAMNELADRPDDAAPTPRRPT